MTLPWKGITLWYVSLDHSCSSGTANSDDVWRVTFHILQQVSLPLFFWTIKCNSENELVSMSLLGVVWSYPGEVENQKTPSGGRRNWTISDIILEIRSNIRINIKKWNNLILLKPSTPWIWFILFVCCVSTKIGCNSNNFLTAALLLFWRSGCLCSESLNYFMKMNDSFFLAGGSRKPPF